MNENLRDIFDKLGTLSASLRGVGALLEQQGSNSSFEHDELFGLGNLLKFTSEEILKIENQLREMHFSD